MEFFRQSKFIKQFNAGDRQAFLEAHERFAKKIFQYFYYKTGADRTLAEELTQCVFYKTWEYLASNTKKEGIRNIQAFLYRIARNLLVDHWRHGGKEPLPLFEELIEVSDNAAWVKVQDTKFRVLEVVEVLKEVAPQYREVVELKYFAQLEIPEICEVLGKSSNSVYVLLHRALRAVRLRLAAREMHTEKEDLSSSTREVTVLPRRAMS